MKTIFRLATITVLAYAVTPVAGAEGKFDPAARARAVAPFVGESTLCVLHVDFARIEVDPLIDRAVQVVPDFAGHEQDARKNLKQIQQAFLDAGFREAYVALSPEDLSTDPPPVIFPATGTPDVDALKRALRDLPGGNDLGSLSLAEIRGAIALATPDMFRRLEQLQPQPRPELEAAFEAAGDTDAQLLVVLGDVHRRVIEELQPTLPRKIGGGPSTVLTRGMLWAAVGVNLPPEMALRLVIQSRDEAAARAFRDVLETARQSLLDQTKSFESAPSLVKALELLKPRVDGDRLTLVLDEKHEGVSALLAAMSAPVVSARTAARRAKSINNLKQIALAMHNFYDSTKSFPAQSNFDAGGRPLLSWRVHILPYLEQEALYKQFHLDEPWDSPHNKTLIAKMPEVYHSPASRLPSERGMASYVFPVGEETVCTGQRGVEFKEITDGTSSTILVIEVADEHAVIWTKPEDFPFDPDNPAKGLGGLFDGVFLAALCDGSVHALRTDLPAKTLRALFTRAGGEPVDF